jgi:hypothetical protein
LGITSLTRVKVQLTDPSSKNTNFSIVFRSYCIYHSQVTKYCHANLETHGTENQSSKGENFKHGCCMYKLVMSKSLAVNMIKSFVSELNNSFWSFAQQHISKWISKSLAVHTIKIICFWTKQFIFKFCTAMFSNGYQNWLAVHMEKIICFWTNNLFSSFAWPHISKWILDQELVILSDCYYLNKLD